MQKNERRAYILKCLQTQASVSVVELSEAFGLSEVSIRKLLGALEKEGVLRRTWGGAVSALGSTTEPSYEEKIVSNLAEKQAIARAAYELINDGDAVYLDSGTTTLQLAKLLASDTKRKVEVFTNALNIAMEFRAAEDMRVVVIGGVFHPQILSCSGSMAQEALRGLFFDKGFISARHFTLERGLTTPNIEEAEVKRAVLRAAKETFALMDYSKYGDNALALIAPVAAPDLLITDWRAPAEIVTAFAEKGARIFCAAQNERVQ